MVITFQHPAVQSLAIVQEHTGRVTLRSSKTRATCTDWWKYQYDHSREFDSVEEAEKIALTVCPIFHGMNGVKVNRPEYDRVAVDRWNCWNSF